ncbi:hypothetical protein RWA06_04535 [Sinorhizobium meliloti]|uniref:hypothetical protein n=1 Tax=Rhizobium meliloti TaxID=382 RepID=UPI00299EF312|nr:hypothetical protein [Sinorhizobium meliloti]
MRALVLAMTVACGATPAFAAECYTNAEDPNWTITKTEDGYRWGQGGKTVDASEGSGGTGVPVRTLVTEDGSVSRFMFHKGDMIVEMEIYTPGCD